MDPPETSGIQRYFYVLFFFTLWNLVLVVFHKYTHKYFHLLYLSYVTLMVGMYFSMVHPAQCVYYYKDKKIVIDKWFYLAIIDILFHITVFLFVYFKYFKYYQSVNPDKLLLTSVLLLSFYLCIIDPTKVYGINIIEILAVISAVNLLYFAIF